MDLAGQRHLPVDRASAWASLNDPEVLKDCIPGCETIERTGEGEYALTIAAALGPVRAKFRGRLKLEDVVAPESYTLRFEGDAGAAGFSKGTAKVRLAEDNGTRMEYTVNAQVGGKLAQVGNRLIDSAARKLAEDFFAAFERRVTPASAAAPQPPARLYETKWARFLLIAAIAVTIIAILFFSR